jgi:AraC-like DNA-binding protein
MDQGSIVRFPDLKRLDVTRIHHDLEALLGPDAMPNPTVMRILRSAIWTHTGRETPQSEIDDAVIQALGELACASVKELARTLCCAPTLISRYFTESFHFASKRL